MSLFAVTVERIADVWTHTNADRLEMARVASMSYQFVIGKGSFKPGDLVIYFPIDSLLPAPVITALGLDGKLSGAEKNRVKTVRLRGEISQGIVAEPTLLLDDWNDGANHHGANYDEGQDVTELLQVTKYEPPPIPSHAGMLKPLPPLVSVYDIEGADRFGALVERLLDEPVMITEKLEGSHFAISINASGEIKVSQRHHRIEPIAEAEHDWHKAARVSGLRDKMPLLKAELERRRGESLEVVTVRGEIIGTGIQGNYYRLLGQQVKIFEIEVNGEPVPAPEFVELVGQFNLDAVPFLAEDVTLRAWLGERSIAEASNGASAIAPNMAREGVVIRPLQEMRDSTIGRLILKQRSPAYLANSDF